jgi:hypothetical protein
VTSESSALASGRLRLGLAVSGPFGPTSELAVLTDVARRQPDHSSFEQAISASGAYSNRIRGRLRNVAELVEAALISINRNLDNEACRTGLIWQLLKALFVVELQLEGDWHPEKTSLIARLNTLTADVSRAEDLRLRLLDIASGRQSGLGYLHVRCYGLNCVPLACLMRHQTSHLPVRRSNCLNLNCGAGPHHPFPSPEQAAPSALTAQTYNDNSSSIYRPFPGTESCWFVVSPMSESPPLLSRRWIPLELPEVLHSRRVSAICRAQL